jgi:hypothetical protein
MGGVLTFNEVFPAAVGVVEHSHDAHDGKATAELLIGGLGIFGLVFRSVVSYQGAAVDGLDDVPAVGVLGANPLLEVFIGFPAILISTEDTLKSVPFGSDAGTKAGAP